MPWRLSARTAAIWVSSTPGTDTAADVRCLAVGTASSAASARTQCIGSNPIGRTTISSSRDRLEQQLGLAHQRRQLGLDTGRGHQFLEALQPGAALATERDGVGLACVQTIDKGVAGLGAPDSSSRPVDTLSCSLIVTFCNLLSPALARLASHFVVCGLSSGGLRGPAPAGPHVIRRRIPTGFGHVPRSGRSDGPLRTVPRTLQPY